MPIITMSRDILAMKIGGKEIENIFLDETGRFEVDPVAYYGITKSQVDVYLFHMWYLETRGELLVQVRDRIWLEQGKRAVEQTEYKLSKEYESEWEHIRREHKII